MRIWQVIISLVWSQAIQWCLSSNIAWSPDSFSSPVALRGQSMGMVGQSWLSGKKQPNASHPSHQTDTFEVSAKQHVPGRHPVHKHAFISQNSRQCEIQGWGTRNIMPSALSPPGACNSSHWLPDSPAVVPFTPHFGITTAGGEQEVCPPVFNYVKFPVILTLQCEVKLAQCLSQVTFHCGIWGFM